MQTVFNCVKWQYSPLGSFSRRSVRGSYKASVIEGMALGDPLWVIKFKSKKNLQRIALLFTQLHQNSEGKLCVPTLILKAMDTLSLERTEESNSLIT